MQDIRYKRISCYFTKTKETTKKNQVGQKKEAYHCGNGM